MLQVIFLDFDGVLHPKMNGSFELISSWSTEDLQNFKQNMENKK